MFFFQAEDGIRDLVRSRGLGDVYKRQLAFYIILDSLPENVTFTKAMDIAGASEKLNILDSVSYTHLTLPTSDLV